VLGVVVRYPLIPDEEFRRINPEDYKIFKYEIAEANKRAKRLVKEQS
jgi:hypothetical protein